MKRFPKHLICLTLLASTFFIGATVLAEPVNPFLMPKMEEILKTAMRVLKEDEGVVSVTPPGDHSLAQGTQILFFRKKGNRLEMIATGKVLTDEVNPKTQKLELKIDLDKDTVIKYPIDGDFAAMLADPNAQGEGNKKDENDYLLPDEEQVKKESDRPGYLEAGMGIMNGQLSTTTSTVANNSKQANAYRFPIQHFAYFSELFPIGIEYDAHKGNFPTSTFYNKVVTSSEKVSTLGLHYRFPPIMNKKLEIDAKINLLSDQFTTDNTDENLLSTQVSGTGIGARSVYSFERLDWRPEKKKKIAFTLQSVTLDALYYPMLSVDDTLVSRGISSTGSSALQFKVSATFLAWLQFVPLFKRWVFQGSLGYRSYNLKFSGATTPESIPSPIVIPEGTRGTEREMDVRFFIGIRLDDPLKGLFSSEKKKKND